MIRLALGVLAATICASGSTSAWARQAPTAVPTSASASQAAPKDTDNDVVCKQEKVTGSRLGGRKICMTRLEWAKQERDAKDLTAHTQQNTTNYPR